MSKSEITVLLLACFVASSCGKSTEQSTSTADAADQQDTLEVEQPPEGEGEVSSVPSGAPKCSDSEVQSLVISMTLDKIKDNLTYIRIYTNYKALVKSAETDESKRSTLAQVDQQASKMAPNLSGIRVNGVDDTIRKVSCAAHLSLSTGRSGAIEYTAQYTEDGQIYVEASGI